MRIRCSWVPLSSVSARSSSRIFCCSRSEASSAAARRSAICRISAHRPEARVDEHRVHEDDPEQVLQQPPPLRLRGAVEGLGPQPAAHVHVQQRHGAAGEQHPPVPVEGQEGQRAEQVEVRLDAATGQVNEQRAPQQLRHGHPVPGEHGTGAHPHQGEREGGERPAQQQGGEQVLPRHLGPALPQVLGEEERQGNGEQPLAHRQADEQPVHPPVHLCLVQREQPGDALLQPVGGAWRLHPVHGPGCSHGHGQLHLTSPASRP